LETVYISSKHTTYSKVGFIGFIHDVHT